MSPFIEVLVNDAGDISYRLHPTTLDTRIYGEVIATLVTQVARMMAHEGNFVESKVRAEVIHFLLDELDQRTAVVTTEMLQ